MTAYAELATASNFSFLRGASHPAELIVTALALGHTGLGLADRNSVAGVVRAWSALRDLREQGKLSPQKLRDGSGPGEFTLVEHDHIFSEADITEILSRAESFKLCSGARLHFSDGTPDIIAYPENRDGWGRLCRLLTTGNTRTIKGQCDLKRDDLLTDTRDLLLIVAPYGNEKEAEKVLPLLPDAAPGAVWFGAAMHRLGDDRRRLARRMAVASKYQIPLLALNDVLYATPDRRDLQDILTCIREGVTIQSAGRKLLVNAERCLKPGQEMARLFQQAPEAVLETQHILSRISFDLAQLKYEYPDEPVPPGWEAQSWLEELTRRCLPMRYPEGASEKVQKLIADELALIRQLDYARYFLTIYDIVRFAESRGILCQGRGSAANSAVCFVLGITSVDPAEHDVLFARFISTERKEPPDI
ncbi:MAG: error-prone DNA polymerase, partial [Beijerinckiaceae bacterium]